MLKVFYCTDIPNFTYPFTSWLTLGSFPLLVSLNNAAINIHRWTLCLSLQTNVFISLEYITSSGIFELYGKYMFKFCLFSLIFETYKSITYSEMETNLKHEKSIKISISFSTICEAVFFSFSFLIFYPKQPSATD